MAEGSEYGGRPGILQSGVGDISDRGVQAPGHDWTTDASESAMVMRRAGLKEAAGVSGSVTYDQDGREIARSGYTEDQAAQDYIDGMN